jgi:hypothetical protein
MMIQGTHTAAGTSLHNALKATKLASGAADSPFSALAWVPCTLHKLLAERKLPAQQSSLDQHSLVASQLGPSCTAGQEVTGVHVSIMRTQAQPDAAATAAAGQPWQALMPLSPGEEEAGKQCSERRGSLGPKHPGQMQPLGVAVAEPHATTTTTQHSQDKCLASTCDADCSSSKFPCCCGGDAWVSQQTLHSQGMCPDTWGVTATASHGISSVVQQAWWLVASWPSDQGGSTVSPPSGATQGVPASLPAWVCYHRCRQCADVLSAAGTGGQWSSACT